MPNQLKIRALFLLAAGSVVGSNAAGIHWGNCTEALQYNPSYQCGTLLVPRDYTQPANNESLQLELIKIPALKQPSKGSILVNTGGPGFPVRDDMNSAGHFYRGLSGGTYDLVGFNVRGSVNTLPFQCFRTDAEAVMHVADTRLAGSSNTQLGRLWARGQLDSALCFERAKETGALISSAFTARDIISIVDALGEDGMLRFWGISYGSLLGATVAAMFPDRVDKMVLDAVVNPHEYYHAQANYEQFSDSDKVVSDMFKYCVKAADKCVLATGNTTAAELEQAVMELIESARQQPIYMPGLFVFVDYSTIINEIWSASYAQQKWPDLFQFFAALLQLRPPSGLKRRQADNTSEVGSTLKSIEASWWLRGIQCGDSFARTTSLKEFIPAVKRLSKVSKYIGDAFVAQYALCNQWAIEPKERYQGSFDVKTKNPVFLVGNRYDAQTGIRAARNVSATFEGSEVLEINGYGHGSLASPSRCTYKHMTAYWQNGTLPTKGKVCESDSPPFSDVKWDQILPGAFPRA